VSFQLKSAGAIGSPVHGSGAGSTGRSNASALSAIRPQTPAYADVSIAIQKALSPPNAIDPKSVARHAAQ